MLKKKHKPRNAARQEDRKAFKLHAEEEKVGSRLRGVRFSVSRAKNRWTKWFPVSTLTREFSVYVSACSSERDE